MFEQLYGADTGPTAAAETEVNIHWLSVQPIQEADFPYLKKGMLHYYQWMVSFYMLSGMK